VVAETRGDVATGTLVPPGAVCMLATDRGVWTHAEFGDIFIYRRGSPAPVIDQRTLPTSLDSRKRRYREFKDAIDLMTEFEQADWDIAGPRTTLWLLRHMFRFGGTPVAHHHRWLAEVRLDYSAAGVSEHLGWCKFFEQAACYDQLNLGQLAAAELGARRLQMIAERWKSKLPNSTGSAQGATDLDDSHLLLGTADTRGNLGVCPQLQIWLGDQLAKEAAASKERRKAREERALAAKPPAK